jgi:hypothetical protein
MVKSTRSGAEAGSSARNRARSGAPCSAPDPVALSASSASVPYRLRRSVIALLAKRPLQNRYSGLLLQDRLRRVRILPPAILALLPARRHIRPVPRESRFPLSFSSGTFMESMEDRRTSSLSFDALNGGLK